jgi:AbrB family looped-hinge helix DNA binding protein
MAGKRKKTSKSSSISRSAGCCNIESVVSVDERGQMVLPKELREKTGINPGDKLAIVSWQKDGAVCCLSLVKVGEFSELVKGMLGPMMTGMSD